MREGAAAEQFRSLFDKADPVAYRYDTDRAHGKQGSYSRNDLRHDR